jgi:hypothetical protein
MFSATAAWKRFLHRKLVKSRMPSGHAERERVWALAQTMQDPYRSHDYCRLPYILSMNDDVAVVILGP